MRITTNNGTTISGSLSEVLATLTHLGVTVPPTKPVTSTEVTETAVTTPFEVVEAELAKLHAGETVMPAPEATPVPVPKPSRDSVIKMAIADVKDLLSRNHTWSTRHGEESNRIEAHVGRSLWFSSEGGRFTVCHGVRFIINAEKRTVIARIGYSSYPEEFSKGRAKCAPGDVFNEHIGKAIALRRALGLTVPVEYYEVEARDSDDLTVGDVVQNKKYEYFSTIVSLIENPEPVKYPGTAHKNDKLPGWNASSQVTLINDSARHTAPDLEVSRIIRH